MECFSMDSGEPVNFMRIVLPVHHFLPRFTAGAELYTYRLARWLQDNGHEVEVIAIEDIESGSPATIDAQHDVFDGIPVWRLSFNLIKAPERRIWEFDNELLGKWFEDYFRRQQPDLAHFQAGYLLGVAPVFAADRQRIPTLLTLHDYWYLCPQHTLQRSDGVLCATVPEDPLICARCRMWGNDPYIRLGRRMGPKLRAVAEKLPLKADGNTIALRRERLQAALDCVTQVIAPSMFMYNQFEHVITSDRLRFSRLGIDIGRLHRERQRGTGETVRFGYVGQVAQHKGVHLLIEAFTSLHAGDKPIELHLWGGVEANPAYAVTLRQAANGDNRIQFHGRFDNRRLPEVLGALDYLVVPSLWYENCPLTILEAYAAHLPVIGSDHGGITELVNHGQDGLVFRPGDAVDLAKAMQSVLDNPQLNTQLQYGARQRFIRDTEDEMQQLLGIYESVYTTYAKASVWVNHV